MLFSCWKRLGREIGLGARITGALAILSVSACGFEALYGQSNYDSSVVKEVSAIRIEPASDRLGYFLRNAVLEHLVPTGIQTGHRYNLLLNLTAEHQPVAFKQDETVTRFNIVVDAQFVLLNKTNEKTLWQGKARSIAAYSIVLSEFANITAAQDAELRAASDLGHAIARQIAAYFTAESKT